MTASIVPIDTSVQSSWFVCCCCPDANVSPLHLCSCSWCLHAALFLLPLHAGCANSAPCAPAERTLKCRLALQTQMPFAPCARHALTTPLQRQHARSAQTPCAPHARRAPWVARLSRHLAWPTKTACACHARRATQRTTSRRHARCNPTPCACRTRSVALTSLSLYSRLASAIASVRITPCVILRWSTRRLRPPPQRIASAML